jgi:hypothetical protein
VTKRPETRPIDPRVGWLSAWILTGDRGGMTTSVADLRRTAPVTLASLAGPCLLLSGLLITITQLALWPLRAGPLMSAVTSPIYVAAMSGYLVGMSVLIIGVLALHQRQAGLAWISCPRPGSALSD